MPDFDTNKIVQQRKFRSFMRAYALVTSVVYVRQLQRDLKVRNPRAVVLLTGTSSLAARFSGATVENLSVLKRKYLTDTLREVEDRVRKAFKNEESNKGRSSSGSGSGPSVKDATAGVMHRKPGTLTSEGGLFDGLGYASGAGSASSLGGRNKQLRTSLSVTPNRGVLAIQGLGILRQMLGGLIYVPPGGFQREDNKPFAMYKPETTDVVFRSRIYKKYGGRWIQRRGLLEKLYQQIGDVIGYGGRSSAGRTGG